jgi:nickel/cobalt transporter (NiCoT) family protein
VSLVATRSAEPPQPWPRRRLVLLYLGLFAGNAIAWLWAWSAGQGRATLVGMAALAYLLGLRHAVDADHIAAIDNVTRKLMQQGGRPVTVGLYFSLGHSTVVAAACVAVALVSGSVRSWLGQVSAVGGVVGTAVSAAFLLAIAAANLVTLSSVWRTWRAARGQPGDNATLTVQIEAQAELQGGILTRWLRPLMALIGRPSQMYWLGLLFGLGFDTASEIGLLGLSAAQASRHFPLWSIMVFPALFAAGMSLVDTTDGVLMTGAYGWALDAPHRKLSYNLIVTLASIVVAVIVGLLEVLGLIADRFSLGAGAWGLLAAANRHFGAIGCLIILGLLACWLTSVVVCRVRARPLQC